ncbi:hypothetical protein [Gimesia maris]|uniref:Uncharacterized protein n=1 Tax=Gimesia maris TaxID=122 RepID=A0ABX5YMQ6_9PLAN|nr:hypothetical protein [Gimesia maris]EDL59424.1 hypothetical protein PM8797T_29788 [Gimesia maris DSM 8797]QEG17021.1 hypothetical protein GmarT_28920 [Gimesia maris]QGQ29857.1 hypothetical protein F1729_15060 [Gimesia maris]
MTRVFVKLAVLVVVVALFGFNRSHKVEKQAKPFAVMENAGAVHSLYRELPLMEIAQALPSNTVDAIDVDTRYPKHVIGIVEVTYPNGKPHRFQTTFKNSAGKSIVKQWQPAEGNPGPTATGLFMLPETIVSGTTKVSESSQ